MNAFLTLIDIIGIKAVPSKTVSPCTALTIFGLELDTIKKEIRLPHERLLGLRNLLAVWEDKTMATKKELQSIIGVLIFCSFGVRWGRAFISRLLRAVRPLKFANSQTIIDENIRSDLLWWKKFVLDPEYRGVSVIIDPHMIEFNEMECYVDSSGDLCAGGLGDDWTEHRFTPEQQQWEISPKELFCFVTICGTYGHEFSGKTIMFPCDNEASVHVINTRRARCPIMASLVRELYYVCARHSFQIKAKHVPGVKNILADALSRPLIRRKAWLIRPTLNAYPRTPVLPTMSW